MGEGGTKKKKAYPDKESIKSCFGVGRIVENEFVMITIYIKLYILILIPKDYRSYSSYRCKGGGRRNKKKRKPIQIKKVD